MCSKGYSIWSLFLHQTGYSDLRLVSKLCLNLDMHVVTVLIANKEILGLGFGPDFIKF